MTHERFTTVEKIILSVITIAIVILIFVIACEVMLFRYSAETMHVGKVWVKEGK
jgi:cell division protein FtsL